MPGLLIRHLILTGTNLGPQKLYLKHAASSMPHHIVYLNNTDADYAMIFTELGFTQKCIGIA